MDNFLEKLDKSVLCKLQFGSFLCFSIIKTAATFVAAVSCWHLAIFPVRRQTSIFAIDELNFRVRNGNGWTLIIINTNCVETSFLSFLPPQATEVIHFVVSPFPNEPASLGFIWSLSCNLHTQNRTKGTCKSTFEPALHRTDEG